MRLAFQKMHGLGNDFVIIDASENPVPMTDSLARAIADRRTGIGCDQLILIEPSKKADMKMRIFNADGGEVEACGNAARCVVQWRGKDATIETSGGVIGGRASGEGAAIDMGKPRTAWQAIPLAYAMDTGKMPVGWEMLGNPVAINVGNPHIVFFVEHADSVELERLGPIIENDPLFPERINVNVASISGPDRLDLRVWERGVGLTSACGTGACATAVAAIGRKLVRSPVAVSLPGGSLTIEWSAGETIRMTGPAAHVFTGEIDTDRLL